MRGTIDLVTYGADVYIRDNTHTHADRAHDETKVSKSAPEIWIKVYFLIRETQIFRFGIEQI